MIARVRRWGVDASAPISRHDWLKACARWGRNGRHRVREPRNATHDSTGAHILSRGVCLKACPLIGISATEDHVIALFDRFDGIEEGVSGFTLPRLQAALRRKSTPGGVKQSHPIASERTSRSVPAKKTSGTVKAGRGATSPTKAPTRRRPLPAGEMVGPVDDEDVAPAGIDGDRSSSVRRKGSGSGGGGEGRSGAESRNPFREQEICARAVCTPPVPRSPGRPRE